MALRKRGPIAFQDADENTLSVDQFTTYLKNNPFKIEELKDDPQRVLEEAIKEAGEKKPAYFADQWLYRWVAVSLGFVTILAAAGAIALALTGKTTPDLLIALGSAAIGALAGLFAPTK